jgi:DNA-directed RNA polymerase specialized sigma24 family protein
MFKRTLAGCDEGLNWDRFGALLHRHRAAVIDFLFRMVQDAMVAEKLAIEVFRRAHRSSARAGLVSQSPTHLFRIATDLALRESRNAPTGQLNEVPGIGQAIASIPGEQRAAVLMHKYHHMDCWQIAKALNCSESVARSVLLSAYENLRRRLAPGVALRQEDRAARQQAGDFGLAKGLHSQSSLEMGLGTQSRNA